MFINLQILNLKYSVVGVPQFIIIRCPSKWNLYNHEEKKFN